MSNPALANAHYISEPMANKGINTPAVLQVGLLHTAMALLLFNSWSSTETPPTSVKTLNIQMYTLPKPVAEPVIENVVTRP
jgi:hypothetical protein